MKDDFGDRMKGYERLSEPCLMPLLPTFARIDGRAFHTFTQGLQRPYDERLSQAMVETTKLLAEETGACMAYTQSDEITLVWYTTNPKIQIWFGGKYSKIVSQVAALTTLYFYRECCQHLPQYNQRLPSFDARVWQVPNLVEASNVFLWREQDATRNSIQMAAQAVYSHKQLHGKNTSEQQQMLFESGINWNDYPAFFKRGTYVQRQKTFRTFSCNELERLPSKHAARTNPGLQVERQEYHELSLPPMGSIQNKVGVIFEGQTPSNENL